MPEDKNKERFIEKETVKEASEEELKKIQSDGTDGKSKKNKTVIIIVIVIIVIIGLAVALMSLGGDGNENTNNTIIPPENAVNKEEGGNLNVTVTNTPSTNIQVNQEVTLTGRVFIKAYGSPSESYGIITTDGNEVGFESYDSMREQFRPYVNESVTVTFSNVCKSTSGNCCKSVFYYCGTVKDWQPLSEDNNE